MSSVAKAANQVRRLPNEIDQLKRAGRDEEAKRCEQHLQRAQAVMRDRKAR